MISCSDKKSGTVQVSEKAKLTISEGAEIFRKNCQICHGKEGIGNIGPNLTDTEWKYGNSDKDILRSIRKGRPKSMPGWEDKLSNEEINKLIAYIRSIGEK